MRLAVVLFCLAFAGNALAAEPNAPEAEDNGAPEQRDPEPQEVSTATSADADIPPPPSAEKKLPPASDIFVPSEAISEDISIDFPVDI